jgi:hypothetical protein
VAKKPGRKRGPRIGPGEVWFVRLPDAVALAKAQVLHGSAYGVRYETLNLPNIRSSLDSVLVGQSACDRRSV